MARLGIAIAGIVIAIVASACTSRSDVSPEMAVTTLPATSDAGRPSTSASPTTEAPVEVALVLDEVERLALRNGVKLEVAIDGVSVGALSDETPQLTISLASPQDAQLTYVGVTGAPTEVTWQQSIDPAAGTVTIVQPWRDSTGTARPHVLAWQRNRATLAEALAEVDGTPVTVVSPLWWNINDEALLSGEADPDYVAAMHARGLLVWPAVQGLHADGLHIMLSDPALRRSIVAELASEAEAAGADGLNIDLEGFRNEDSEGFSAFVEELTAAVHEWGGTVSYDLVPRSDTWDVTPPELAFWSTAPDRRRLAEAVDYTVLMAYDQHNRYRPAGPVAAPGWVEELVIYQLRYSDPHEVILGLPAYGRLWDPDELDAPRALGFGALAEVPGTRTPDPEFGVDRVEVDDGRFYWADHEMTPVRVAIGDAYGLSGVAVWRLGLDDPSLWEAIAS